jgi:hypothetical protein
MACHPDKISTFADLTEYVHFRLCARESLLEDQFTTEAVELRRADQCCGVQFRLRGPRNVCLQAIWSSEQNELYLYDSRGTRYEKLRLPQRPAGPVPSR